MLPWVTVVTSAAVGAFASAVVNLIGQWLERSSRRKDLVLSKAVELASLRTETVMRIAKDSGTTATILDHVALTEVYFRWLQHLMDKGELPPSAPNRLTKLL